MRKKGSPYPVTIKIKQNASYDGKYKGKKFTAPMRKMGNKKENENWTQNRNLRIIFQKE